MTKEEAICRLEAGAPFSELYDEEWENALIMAIESLKAESVKHGHWIDRGSGQECSVCGEIQYGHDSYRNYCANCGAQMSSEENK